MTDACSPSELSSAASRLGLVVGCARFAIGQVVHHRVHPFRGVIYDIDPVFSNSETWLEAIPEDIRPRKDQPFYHLLAESEEGPYMAYVSEQNLVADDSGLPVQHPDIERYFGDLRDGRYQLRASVCH